MSYLGIHKNVNDLSISGLKEWVKTVNHVGPSVSTLSAWRPPLSLQPSTHVLEVLLHIKLLQQSKSPIQIKNDRVVR